MLYSKEGTHQLARLIHLFLNNYNLQTAFRLYDSSLQLVVDSDLKNNSAFEGTKKAKTPVS